MVERPSATRSVRAGNSFAAYDVVWFMASVDKPEDNKAFAEKEQADFPILSDPDKTVANAYGVIPAGRTPDRQMASRWTFYIGPDGKILAIEKTVKPATAGEEIVAKLAELGVKKKKYAHYNAARGITGPRAALAPRAGESLVTPVRLTELSSAGLARGTVV